MTRIQKFDLDEITIPKKMKKAKPKLYKIMGNKINDPIARLMGLSGFAFTMFIPMRLMMS